MPPHASSSRSRRNGKDRRMDIDHLLYGASSRQPSTHESTNHASFNSFLLTSSSSSSQGRLENESSSINTARRDFVIAITRPSTRRGYLECRLCESEVWGPNGRYHIDKCPVLQEARETARRHGVRLTSVSGIAVHPDVFKSTKKPQPKPAKIPGFVMSHSVSMLNPTQALTEEEIDSGMQRGRKGYVRCLRCNTEVFAPNARNHAAHCRKISSSMHH